MISNRFYFYGLTCLLCWGIFPSYGQSLLNGIIVGPDKEPVIGATVEISKIGKGVITSTDGKFSLENIPQEPFRLIIKHLEYEDLIYKVDPSKLNETVRIVLKKDTKLLNEIDIVGLKENENTGKASTIEIEAEGITAIPTAFGDISKVLVTLPGVSTTNELSSTFAVRGGNFDENRIYINDIPVYRPFLVSAGRQEGLSAINADLVQNILFSAGGWESKYGDKLSSVLNITYKEPEDFEGSVNVGLLTSSLSLGGKNKSKSASYLIGARRKSSTYLLNSLETDGQYLPRFFDIQGLLTASLSQKRNRSRTIQWFNSYARNRYEVTPITRRTEFGGVGEVKRLLVGFEGKELLNYDTYQTGLSLDYQYTENLKSKLILSAVRTQEVERVNLEGAYELCDIDKDPNESSLEACISNRAFGTFFNYGRNRLDATILTGELRNEIKISDKNLVSFGAGISSQNIDDQLSEYAFVDSADFITVTDQRENKVNIIANDFFGFIQDRLYFKDSLQYLIIGLRANYRDINNQFLLAPRLLYSLKLNEKSHTTYKLATGVYHQPPFYRELRDRDGNVNNQIKAQSSRHYIVGVENVFMSWGRPFKLMAEAYYKQLYNLNPYEVNNVRIRYFGNNAATGYSAGFDFRINGEFVKGAQSWFSLGYLQSKEDIIEDNKGLIRRPSDQRVNIGIFFQDYFQNNPSMRVNLSLLYASNLPFGPPDRDDLRNFYAGDDYVRTDIGFAKIITLGGHSSKFDIETISIGLDILNLFGTQNSISYTWVKDVDNVDRPVPNSLSARFLNARVSVKF